MQEDKNWMKFERSGRVADYLRYCQQSRNCYGFDSQSVRNEDDKNDGAELYTDRYGSDFHAGGGV